MAARRPRMGSTHPALVITAVFALPLLVAVATAAPSDMPNPDAVSSAGRTGVGNYVADDGVRPTAPGLFSRDPFTSDGAVRGT